MRIPAFVGVVLLALTGTSPAGAGSPTAYLFAYFVRNGEDGLHLAWSADGFKWESLHGGRSLLAPKVGKAKLMRDPCLARGPDGTYHMVWTTGWKEDNIGYAATKDFLTWTEQREIPAMAHEPTVRNCWAPEVFWDEARGEFLVFWASTVPGRFPATPGSDDPYNHRIYATTTKDFAAFTPTRLFHDPGFSVIDATIVPVDGGFALIVKDETKTPAPKKHLRIARSATPQGPWGELGPPLPPAGVWVEGPTAIKTGGDFLVYFDVYVLKRYGAVRSRDLVTWEDVTAETSFPDEGTPQRVRHGTAIEVPRGLIETLQGAEPPLR